MSEEPNEIIAVSKAVEETAKIAGKAIDASSALGKWLDRIFGNLVENGVGLASDRLRYYRLDQLNRIHEKFETKWKARGLGQAEPLSTGVAIKVIDEASLAEDDSLQELWANLLVNGMNPEFEGSIERSYVSILAELTPCDAVVFDHIATLPQESFDTKFRTKDMQDIPFNPLSAETEVSICNTHRLGLLRSRSDTAVSNTSGGMLAPRLTLYRGGENLILSALGECFHKAIS